MYGKDILQGTRCFGSATVSPRGQVVIPVNARKELGIDTGATLLVFAFGNSQGLLLIKADAVEQIISTVSERLSSIEHMLKAADMNLEEVNEED